MADTPAATLLAGIRDFGYKPLPAGNDIFDQAIRAARDVPLLLAAIEDLTAALVRHREWFTDKTDTRICGGCLRPAPCPDDPDTIVARALSGKDSSDGK